MGKHHSENVFFSPHPYISILDTFLSKSFFLLGIFSFPSRVRLISVLPYGTITEIRFSWA